MTTNTTPGNNQPLSAAGQAAFRDRARLIIRAAADLSSLLNRYKQHERNAYDAFDLACENMYETEPSRTTSLVLAQTCENLRVATIEFVGTTSTSMRFTAILSGICISVAMFAAIGNFIRGKPFDLMPFLIMISLSGGSGLLAASWYNSTFRRAFDLRAQLERDLDLAIKVIEDDASTAH